MQSWTIARLGFHPSLRMGSHPASFLQSVHLAGLSDLEIDRPIDLEHADRCAFNVSRRLKKQLGRDEDPTQGVPLGISTIPLMLQGHC